MRARAPRRERSGWITGTPFASSGAAVTGPTHAATTEPLKADRSESSRLSALAALSIASTAGALVKATASTEPEIAWVIRRRSGEASR